jgi:hypothetical protein
MALAEPNTREGTGYIIDIIIDLLIIIGLAAIEVVSCTPGLAREYNKHKTRYQ